jgi:hypothetical protein
MAIKKTTVGINVQRLDQLIDDLGIRVRLFKSALCPNLKSLESMDHDINCTQCNNSMIDFCPTETVALFQQQDLAKQFQVQGTFHLDEVMVTFHSGVTLATFSKVELLDFEEDFYELIQRQEGTNTDKLKYPACEALGCFTVSTNSTTTYHYGVDFSLDVNGDLQWLGTHKPADRQVYSVYYKFKPVFRAIKAVHRDRYSQYNLQPEKITSEKTTLGEHTYVKLPETWILKRDYLVERRDANNTKIEPNVYYDPNEA